MTYRLSNRQDKELRDRGTALLIAIPEPHDCPEDTELLAWAREQLPDVPGEWIASATLDELLVRPGGGTGLTQAIGEITEPRPGALQWLVLAVIIEIVPPRARHRRDFVQWAGVQFLCSHKHAGGQMVEPPSSEFDHEFVTLMKHRMLVSYHKYGPIASAFPHKVDAVASLRKRLEQYLASGNTEFLVDVANYAMIEFMLPSHENAHFRATDSDESPGRKWHSGGPFNKKNNQGD